MCNSLQQETLVHNIVSIVPTVDQYGSLKLWANLALDEKYWKYLINGIRNAPTNSLVPPPYPATEIEQPPSPPSTPRPIQSPSDIAPNKENHKNVTNTITT